MRQTKNEYHKLAAAIRRCCRIQPAAAFSIGLAVGLSSSPAVAGPEGGVVTQGTGTITQTDATTTIGQASNFLRIDWQSFNIAAHESVLFQQPGSSSVALNRIHDQSPSQIFGTVQANGQIFLVNPNGIYFGHTAQVNVGSLVASSLDVLNYDAATGHFSLGGKAGAVVNDGTLTAARGGSVSLIGGSVANNGLIVADYGVVNLAAGETATLDFFGDGLMRFEIDDALTSGSGTAVNNAGTIQANGGKVFLTAEAAHGVFDRVINNEGVIRANRIENVGGTIRLLGPEGTVINSGTLDASGVGSNSTGGTVSVLGDHVGLFGDARIDVSGDAGGGTALIGGDYQGSNPDVLNASRTFVSSGSLINANARVDGDGGKVVVWADEITRFQGLITARGVGSGDGGFAEVSGKDTLLFRGFANLGSANGRNGRLLLDPENITIADGGDLDLIGAPNDGNDNIYAFSEDANQSVTIDADAITTLMDAGTDVELQAHTDINVDEDIDAGGSTTEGASLIMRAGDDITLAAGVNIITANGNVILSANDPGATPDGADGTADVIMNDGSTIQTGNGNVQITAEGTIRVTTITTTGDVSLTSTDGAIEDDADPATRISANLLAMTAGTTIGGAGADQIDTAVTSIDATGPDGIFINELDGLNGVTASSTDQTIAINANGNVVLTDVNAGSGPVVINAGTGSLTDSGTDNSVTTSGLATLTAASIGTDANNRLNTDVGSLNATANTGALFIEEESALSALTATTTNQALNIRAGGNVAVTSVNAGSGDVSLTATGGALTDGAGAAASVSGQNVTLSAATIGTNGNRFGTSANTLNATTTNGDQFITDQGGLTLTASATGGTVDVTSTDGMTVQGVTGSSATLNTTGSIFLQGAVNVSGSANLTAAGAGAEITDSGASTAISANALTLNATANIGTLFNPLNTAVTSLTSTTGGNQFITEADALTLNANAGAGAILASAGTMNAASVTGGLIALNSTGDMTLGAINGEQVLLTSSGGQLVDDGNDSSFVTAATSIELTAATNIGTVTDIAAGTGSSIDVDTAGTLSVVSNANNGEVNLNFAQAPILGSGSIRLGTGIGTDGQILLQSAGDLNASTFAADAIVIGAGNSTEVGLRAGGTLTMPTSGVVTDAAPETLALFGGTDIQDTDRVLSLTAGNLIFESGNAAGVVGLLTNVDTITASVDPATDLLISDANDIVVRSLEAGSVFLDAAGATGAITGGPGTNVTASTLQVQGNNVTLNTDVDTLELFANTNATITNTGALNLASAQAGNALTVTSTGTMDVGFATAQAVNLTSTGNMTLNTVSAGPAGTVVLTANGGAVTDGAATSVSANSLTINAATIGTAGNRLDTLVAELNTTTTGNQFIAESDALTLTAAAGTGAVDVTSGGAMTVTSVTGGSANLASAGDMTVGSVNVGGGNAALTAAGGTLADAAGDAPSVIAGTAALNAATIGTAANRFGTSVATLNTASTGDQFITEADALILNAAGGAIDVTSGGAMTAASVTGSAATLTSAGNMTVGTVNVGAGNATLTATGGALTDGAGNAPSLTAANATLDAATIGTSGNRFGTSVAALNATSTGDQFIAEADALTLTAAAGAGAVDVTSGGAMTVTNVTGGTATLASTGNMTVGTINVGGGNATLTATGGALTDGAGVSVTAGTLTATAATIGTSAASRFETAVDTLNTTTTGNQFLSDQGTLVLNANAGAGAVDAVSTGVMTASVTGGSTTLSATGGMTLDTVNVTGNASLSTTGALTDSDDAGDALTAGSANLTAASIGTSTNRLNTSVGSLTASTSAGGMFIGEADAVSLGMLNATGVGNTIDVLANGAVTQTGNFTTANGAIIIDAASISMNAGTNAVSNNGRINYLARSGDVQLSFLDGGTGNVFVAAGQSILANATVNFVEGSGLDVRGGRVDLRAGGTFAGGTPPRLGMNGQGIDVVTTGPEAETLFLFIPTQGGAPVAQAFVNFAGGAAGTVAQGSPAPVNQALFFDPAAVLDEIDESGFIVNITTQGSLQQTFAGEEQDDTSIDWSVFDPNVALFGTVGQPVRLPADQLEEEEETQVSMLLVPAGETLVITQQGLRRVKVYRPLMSSSLIERS